jgi:hypothetical protein
LAAIGRLTGLFGGRVWLVSKCGPHVQARTLRRLNAHDFYRRTGITPGHARFCRTRQNKRIHCQDLTLTHFVDDHPDVHTAIRGTVDYQYFFGPQHRTVPGYGIPALTWHNLENLIAASLAARDCPRR